VELVLTPQHGPAVALVISPTHSMVIHSYSLRYPARAPVQLLSLITYNPFMFLILQVYLEPFIMLCI
jgi:hypothetical protein